MVDLAGIMVRDFDGAILFWSEGCQRIYGWTAEEAVGQPAHALLRTAFPTSIAEIEAALHRDGECVGEFRQWRQDGVE